MEFVSIWYGYRCWSKILFGTIPTRAYDLEVKVMDFEIMLKFWVIGFKIFYFFYISFRGFTLYLAWLQILVQKLIQQHLHPMTWSSRSQPRKFMLKFYLKVLKNFSASHSTNQLQISKFIDFVHIFLYDACSLQTTSII